MDIRRLYPLLLLLVISNPHSGCGRNDNRNDLGDDSQEGDDNQPRSNCGSGCGAGCSSPPDDSTADDSNADDSKTDDSIDTGPWKDEDGDNYTTETDCDDENSAVYPGAPELCDDRDNDCDEAADDGLVACFFGETNNIDYSAVVLAGTEAAPAELTLAEAGRLSLGEGTFYAGLVISANMTVAGAGDGKTTLSGGGVRTILTVSDNPSQGYAVIVSGLTLKDGYATNFYRGDSRYRVGGAVYCMSTAESGSSITVDSISASGGDASMGTTMFLSGCETTVTDSVLSGAGALVGNGGIYLENGGLTLERVTVSDYAATLSGGAVFVNKDGELTLRGSTLIDNTTEDSGAGVFTHGPVVCEDSGVSTAGVRSGSAERLGGGIFLFEDAAATLTSTGCDWGSGDDDNNPDDVASDYFYGAQFSRESFFCDAYNGCTIN